jgi:hypothetical protein
VSGLQALKAHLLVNGVSIDPAAEQLLTNGGATPLSIHEYATTGGVTIRLGDLYANAPFGDAAKGDEAVRLTIGDGDLPYALIWEGERLPCEVLPLPGYLSELNSRSELVVATTMSHADRIRVSPIQGCAYDCGFCDMADDRYRRHSLEELLASIEVAKRDSALPPRHLLISGGTPGRAHWGWFEQIVVGVAGCGLPTDVMMSANAADVSYIKRFVDAGVAGFSFNLEVMGDARAASVMPMKAALSSPFVDQAITEAVAQLGAGTGAVRSLIIVGLEDPKSTLRAVERIARLGADPVLSPFRPAPGTRLAGERGPSVEELLSIYDAATEIVNRYGVLLGPRCAPCQHNTMALPVTAGALS